MGNCCPWCKCPVPAGQPQLQSWYDCPCGAQAVLVMDDADKTEEIGRFALDQITLVEDLRTIPRERVDVTVVERFDHFTTTPDDRAQEEAAGIAGDFPEEFWVNLVWMRVKPAN